MKVEIDIEIPQDHEVDEGKQPRYPKNGESFIYLDGSDAYQMQGGNADSKAIILKKKAPEYITDTVYIMRRDESFKMVSINALEDSLALIDETDLTGLGLTAFRNLKELL